MVEARGDLELRTGIVEVADGVKIAYEEAGAGEPSIVLIHGMACDRTQMRAQLDHLAPTHRVVAIDMRGHGESDQPEGDYGFEVLRDDLHAVITALDLDRPVLIGHSLGGSVSLSLAVAHPDVVAGVVLLDSGLRHNRDKSAELGPFYATLGGPDHDTRVREFVVARLFEPVDDPEVAAAVAATMGAVPAHAFLAMAKGVLAFDGAATAAACTLPSMLIMSKTPFLSAGAIDELGPNWMIGRVVDAGHFIQMLVPEQVHPMLDRYLLQFTS